MQQEAGGGLGCPPNPDSPPPQICVSPHPSDMTTLTAAAYQQGLAVHAGTHILNMQGEEPGGGARTDTPRVGLGGTGGWGQLWGTMGCHRRFRGAAGQPWGSSSPPLQAAPGGTAAPGP